MVLTVNRSQKLGIGMIILIDRQSFLGILRVKNKFSSVHYLCADTDSGASQLANPVGKRDKIKVTRG